MLRLSSSRFFFGNFSVGFSKGFSGNGTSGGSFPGNTGGGASSGSGADTFGGLPGPLGGFLDKALEWCSESHARDIARQQGLDLRDIRFERTEGGGVNVMVDAPNATPLQIEQLGQRVQEECPVARFRKTTVSSPGQQMKWLRIPDKYDR